MDNIVGNNRLWSYILFLPCAEIVKSSQTCMGETATLSCSGSQVIRLVSAHFGRVGFDGEKSCGLDNAIGCNALPLNCGYTNVYEQVVRTACEPLQSTSQRAVRERPT
jgi:hypothetical protein